MPKLKTHRGAAKRFSITGTGRVKRNKAYASHIMTTKTRKRKRNLRRSVLAHPTNEPALKRLIPYL
jgi:large subunit ribosomal protein L35